MNKILVIIGREYITRVRKTSFIVISILGPIVMLALMFFPMVMEHYETEEVRLIAVADSSHLFINKLPETETIKFVYLEDADLNKQKERFKQSDYYALLYIGHNVVNTTNSVCIYSNQTPSMSMRMHIANYIEKRIEEGKLWARGVNPDVLQSVKTKIEISTVKLSADGNEKTENFVLMEVLGYVLGFVVYIMLILTGNMVMRSVIEEKSNRIVEIIVSSVKPVQLMIGKIVGVSLVAFTQFAIWIGVTAAIYITVVSLFVAPDVTQLQSTQQLMQASGSILQQSQPAVDDMTIKLHDAMGTIGRINFGGTIAAFLLFFFGGYFLYAALFAAVGSVCDNETDSQQFVFPITLPLIIAIIVMVNTIQAPDTQLSFWFSIIPFTSPIIMMARIPYGVPYTEIFLAATLLILTFMAVAWGASKIYSTGILMHGTKPTWRNIFKWIKQK